jgi:hypothetical protein
MIEMWKETAVASFKVEPFILEFVRRDNVKPAEIQSP